MKKILIIGAGKTGRGFIPQYIKDSEIYFADQNKELVQKLQCDNQYTIEFYGKTNKKLTVKYEKACHIKSEEFYHLAQTVDFIFISIDVSHYEDMMQDLNLAFNQRTKSLTIITFENAICASQKIYSLLPQKIMFQLTILDAGVFCTTNESNHLNMMSQDLLYLPIQYSEISLPLVPITLINDFKKLMERKLYTYNCLSAVICYQGYVYQYHYLGEAAHDERIKQDIKVLLDELDQKIAMHFQIPLEEQKEFSKNAVTKFSDLYLEDSIQRNARNVIRKLGAHERLLKPLELLEGNAREVILKTIAMACYYDQCEETKAGITLIDHIEISHILKDKIRKYYQRIEFKE